MDADGTIDKKTAPHRGLPEQTHEKLLIYEPPQAMTSKFAFLQRKVDSFTGHPGVVFVHYLADRHAYLTVGILVEVGERCTD